MSNRKGPARGERHIRLYHWMLRSAAWAALSPNGKAVLLDIWKCHNGANNGQIVYSAREAGHALHASNATGARVLNELVRIGFLRIIRDSAFRFKSAEAREYALTAEPVDGRAATKDFMRWNPATSPTKIQNTVSPMRPNGLIHETVKTGIPKTTRKNNSLSEGVRGAKNAAREKPLKTAETSQKSARNRASTVSSVRPSRGGNGLTGETLLYIHGLAAAERPPGRPAGGASAGSRRPVRFGDQARAERTRRLH